MAVRRVTCGTGSILSVVLLSCLVFSSPNALTAADFIRGDIDANGHLDIADPLYLLFYRFVGNVPMPPCADAADADDNGALEVADALRVLALLFLDASPPPPPYPGCGADGNEVGDPLDCAEYPACVANVPPTAEFTRSPTSGAPPLEVLFDASGSNDPDGTIVSYSWDFDDGETASGDVVSHTFLDPGNFDVTLTVTDDDDATAEATRLVSVVEDTPPDPTAVAPPLDSTVVTTVHAGASFLYTGPDPIQTDVVPDEMEPLRAAVLRGLVLDRAGTPLSGVRVSILGHPELGMTLSRLDGMFDLVVNGGGALTVNYHLGGYLPAQRQVSVPWQEYTWLPDVVLIEKDPVVTPLALEEPGMKAARGGEITDEDGTRRGTVLIPEGTGAEILLPDGSRQSVDTLSIRVTEYTVGDNGPEAMPAELPPTSGYTYAMELTADEAVAKIAGKDVLFDRPVYYYVENFLNFPVGGVVPVGYYDSDRSAWVPSDNGRVIGVVAIVDADGDIAEVDVDGDEVADTDPALSDLGLTDAERRRLAALYTPGQSLWRVPISHFSTWDCNWPYGPPDDAEPPDLPEREYEPDRDRDCEERKCLIDLQRQILGERLDVVGTPFTLNYRSDRVPGRLTEYTVEIPLSGSQVPASLARIDLRVFVAGQRHRFSFPPRTNYSYRFVWDGLDAYQRPVQGKQTVLARVGYVYPPVYMEPDEMQRAFSRFSGSGLLLTGSRARQQVVIWRNWRGTVGGFDARAPGLGGWTLDAHHAYDAIGRTIYLGDGRRYSADSFGPVIETIAGDGDFRHLGDGGPATEAFLSYPSGLAVAPDGSLYIADTGDHRIRRIDPEGIITTVAGTGWRASTGDGGPATEADVDTPTDVAVGPDGSIYIAARSDRIRRIDPDGIITTVAGGAGAGGGRDGDPAVDVNLSTPWAIDVGPDHSIYITASKKIRRVGPDGIITTIAGGGSQPIGEFGNGGPALEAVVPDPRGFALGPDGSLYIADYRDEIRRVTPDGIITRFAGSRSRGFSGDGGPADAAELNIPGNVGVAIDGTVYIADTNNHRIRRVGLDGIITTVAGSSSAMGFSGDGGPAASAELNSPADVAIGPNGELYIADRRNLRIRKVSAAMPGLQTTDLAVPSRDGRRVYVFDVNGRHLRTRDSLTGAVVYRFDYDSRGLLSAITDRSDNATTIERDAAGEPLAIIGTDGLRTELVLDANGYLTDVTDPSGEATELEHADNGLLTRLTDRNGEDSIFLYDPEGRLAYVEDASGGTRDLDRRELGEGFQVTRTTGVGRTTVHRVEQISRDVARMINALCGDCGIETTSDIHRDGKQDITFADGTTVHVEQGPDPRFGMTAPLLSNYTVTLPSGLQSIIETEVTATLTDASDPLSLETSTVTVRVNGRQYSTVYDAGTRSITATSPAGRTAVAELDELGYLVRYAVGELPYALHYDTDDRGRLETIVIGPGDDATVDRVYTYGYDAKGFVASVDAPLGRRVDFTINAAGNITQLDLSDGRRITALPDPEGNVLAVTPPGRLAHSFDYTPTNRMESYTPPAVPGIATPSTSFGYNTDGDLETIARPDGTVISAVLETARKRLERVDLPGGGTLSCTYHDGVGGGSNTGRLRTLTLQPENVSVSYAYDGVLLTTETWEGAVAGVVSRTWNSDFNPATLVVNDAGSFSTSYGYDPDRLVVSAHTTGLIDAGVFTVARDAANGPISGTDVGTVVTASTYNGFAETASMSAVADGAAVYEAIYDTASNPRDQLGRITRLSETVERASTQYDYGYDDSGRLANVWRNGDHIAVYTYDANGNRIGFENPTAGTAITSDQIDYDAQDRLRRYGERAYTYTDNGELLSKSVGDQVTDYVFDAFGSLRAVTLPDGTEITYIVDGRSRRVAKEVNGARTHGFLYQDGINPVAELDAGGGVVSVFVYATQTYSPDYMVSRKLDGTSWAVYRMVTDHLGSPRLIIDVGTGVVAQRLDYDVFGSVTLDTRPGFQPFGFSGGIHDPETGLVLLGAREYDPEVGRWTAKDPLLFAGGSTNLYEYVGGDPVNGFDPLGLGWDLARWAWNQAPVFIEHSPWLAGFADGFTEIPFTDTSVSEWAREGLDMNSLIDPCSHRYRAGVSMGKSTQIVLGAVAMAKTALSIGDEAASAVWHSIRNSGISASDAWTVISGIKGGYAIGYEATVGAGAPVPEILGDPQ